jgi:glutathione S-transferase
VTSDDQSEGLHARARTRRWNDPDRKPAVICLYRPVDWQATAGGRPVRGASAGDERRTTEIHVNFRPFFFNAPQPEKDKARQMLDRRFATIAGQLDDKPFLVSDRMTISDPYLFVMLSWAAMFGIDVPERLSHYLARMRTEPSVAKALAEEGLAAT